MRSEVILMLAGYASCAVAYSSSFLRDLQTLPTNTTPKAYGDDIVIGYKSELGCGACIRGGYIYCIPGAEGSDSSTWGTKKANCCKDAATCSQLKDMSYLCSNAYTDTTLAKAMCPFKKNNCGNSTAFVFDSVGQQ